MPSDPEIIGLLRIQRGFLGSPGAMRSHSICTGQSTRRVEAFAENLPQSVQYIIRKDRLIARSALVATELLGEDGEDNEDFKHKSALHLLMTAEMTLQMLFDDLLDLAGRVPDGTKELVLRQVLLSFERCASNDDFDLSSEAQGFWSDVLMGLAAMQRWRNELLVQARISVRPDSVSRGLYASFVGTYYHVHDDFNDLGDYIKHRVDNCGMPLQGFWAAHWHARAQGLDPSALEEQGDFVRELLYEYAVLGGLSNDIVGYDKDIVEGVATAVEVLARKIDGPRDRRIVRSFEAAIVHHNKLLDDLGRRLTEARPGSLQHVVLYSALRTAWSIHVLHECYLDVYRPRSLMHILT